MNAREQLLAGVRARLQARPDRAEAALPPPLPIGDVAIDTAARLQQFRTRLTAVGAELRLCTPERPALAHLGELLAEAPDAAVAWSDAALLQPLRQALHRGRPGRDVGAEAPLADLFGCGIGVTTAQWGVAASGTLVLVGSDERSRLASLLPPLHVALLPASRLLATLGEALKVLPRPLPAAVTFVTGPSRTADIELQLVVGVHGPRRLVVVLC